MEDLPFKLTETKRRMLSQIAQTPRRVTYFTHKDVGLPLHPEAIRKWLAEMVENGLIFEADQAFHITVLGRQKLDQKNMATQRSYVEGRGTYRTGMGETYQQMRVGAEDFLKYKSKGVRC